MDRKFIQPVQNGGPFMICFTFTKSTLQNAAVARAGLYDTVGSSRAMMTRSASRMLNGNTRAWSDEL